MLVGRRGECGRLDGLLTAARGGTSSALVIRGEAGIGKSALLEYAREHAGGMTVLSVSGLESEAQLPFAGLSALLRPQLDLLERIPAPQAAALAGALALGPPSPGDRFAVAAGTLSVLAASADDRPLLVLVDDAHWLDAPSAEAIRFATRRLGSEGILLLIAVRDGDRSAFDSAGVPELRLDGLEPGAARELLVATAVHRLTPPVATRLLEAARGNPLALAEIPTLLSDAQLAGNEPLPEPLPVGASIERAFRRRLAALPPESQRALTIAAASEAVELDTILAAMRSYGLDEIALEPAEGTELVTTAGGQLTWRHPLLRSAVYQAANPSERRAAHRALADALVGAPSAAERAWHLANAATGPDESVAHLLEETAVAARDRRGPAASAAALERAAGLSEADAERARRLLEAARDYKLVGRTERARTLLDEAAALTADPLLESDIEYERGWMELWTGDPTRARHRFLAAADRVEPLDRRRAVALLIDAVLGCQMTGDVHATLAAAQRAHALAETVPEAARPDASPLLLNSLILAGRAREARHPVLLLAERALETDEASGSVHFLATVGHALVWIEEYELARRLFDRELERARRQGSVDLVPYTLGCLAELDFRTGRWEAVYAGASEAVELCEETAQRNVLAFCLVCLARVEAATGRADECRQHVSQALELADTLQIGSIPVYGLSVLGLLELGLGHTDEALTHLEPLSALVETCRLREPGTVQWAPDLIEACILASRTDEAREALAAFQEQARQTGRTWALATAARCRGMLGEDDFEREFAEALRWHEPTPTLFERARTELRLGERLRRAKRPLEARVLLRSALATFEWLGASPWAEQAHRELAATGERGHRPALPSMRELTAQELRIALLVAAGATNREAAAALFLSPKTVGFHLGKVYAKLSVRSRTELAAVMAREEAVGGETASSSAGTRAGRRGPARARGRP